MLRLAALFIMSIYTAAIASATSLEQTLAKLDPEERSRQACALKALDVLRRDPRLRQADRLKSSIFQPAQLMGAILNAPGGAVRAGGRWFAISYSCRLTNDYMKATSFTFTLGKEIQRIEWDQRGLWG